MYQDRRATDGQQPSQINGNNGSKLEGAFYFPRADFTFNGTPGMTTNCLQIVDEEGAVHRQQRRFSNVCPPDSGGGCLRGQTDKAGRMMTLRTSRARRSRRLDHRAGAGRSDPGFAADRHGRSQPRLLAQAHAGAGGPARDREGPAVSDELPAPTALLQAETVAAAQAAGFASTTDADVTVDYWLECNGVRAANYNSVCTGRADLRRAGCRSTSRALSRRCSARGAGPARTPTGRSRSTVKQG